MSPGAALHRFGIAPLAHTGLFGVFLGCHALADALQILHTGVGCKGKTQRHLVEHDLGHEAHAKVGWTELSETDWIRDPLARLRTAARELQRRRQAGALFLTASTAVEFTGVDLAAAARALEAELGVPVFALPGVAAAPDLYAGYGAVVRALLERVDWTRPAAGPPRVALAGYFFHRYEHEQSANLSELRRLAEGLGAPLGPVLLSGEALAPLLEAHGASGVLALPYAGLDASALGRLTGRSSAVAGLPLGVRATTRWLETLGALLGVAPGRIQRFTAREAGRAAPRLALARRGLAGRRLAIVADTPLAAGWVLLAEELGLPVPLVVLLDRTLGGEAGLRRFVADAGGTLSAGTQVVEDPSLRELRALGGPAEGSAAARPGDLAVRPDLGLAGTGWARIPTLEVGLPAPHKHFVYPLPELGYAGAVALAQRLLDAAGGVH